ncbi:MAG: NAD(P)/FAD-dependent oxidoreductase [Actinomycetes bacterium]
MTTGADRIRSRSLWLDTCDDDLTPRPALAGRVEADVVVVGGGMTGLWTSLYLREAAPDCRVVVLEAEVCGFGASGRNGGWCSALFPASLPALESMAGRDAAVAQWRAMASTVDQVLAELDRLHIDAHAAKGGTLTVATNRSHLGRLRHELEVHRAYGFGSEDLEWLEPSAMRRRIGTADCFGGLFTPHCAAVHPARLVRGLARAAEAAGAVLHERSRVVELGPGTVRTDGGTVVADTVLRCTEGYTPSLDGHRRDVLPLYSLMVATEPLDDDVWAQVGLAGRETFSDGRHLLVYGQRTADGRLAFGGRGAPYHWGSAVADRFDTDVAVHDALVATLHELFPVTRDARITHRWGGPLAVPRDWCASVHLDRPTGVGSAGGYVGDGVSTTHLAGRTLADLVLGHDTERTRLPWVGHTSPAWEPEPLRWLGVNVGRAAAAAADRRERRTGREATGWGKVLGLFTGGH